jgi:hypothetical protein
MSSGEDAILRCFGNKPELLRFSVGLAFLNLGPAYSLSPSDFFEDALQIVGLA